MKEVKKSATTLVSFYITDKANWKPESLHFFKLLVPCNVEAVRRWLCRTFITGRLGSSVVRGHSRV
jgi:hypothetical protein